MKKTPSLLPNRKKIIAASALAAIIAGAVFVVNYPRTVWRYETNMQRLMEMQDLEQALEWYMFRQAMEEASKEAVSD